MFLYKRDINIALLQVILCLKLKKNRSLSELLHFTYKLNKIIIVSEKISQELFERYERFYVY